MSLRRLVGKKCSVDFNLEPREWPIAGYPAHVIVDDVDMPMVKMRSIHAGSPVWVNASTIKTIVAWEQEADIEMVKRLHGTTDAQVWAREFQRVLFDVYNIAYIDEAWLIGWFANAIEIGRAAGKRSMVEVA